MSTVYIPSAERPRDAHGGGGAAGPLGIAGLCIVALALTWVLTALVPAGQFKDAVALHHFTVLRDTPAHTLASLVLLMLEPPLYIASGVALIALALARERARVAFAVGVVMTLTPLSAEALKPLLAHPHTRIGMINVGPASWPSGHSSAALALALCAVLVAPASRRAIVAVVGVGFALAVGCALLILAWHMPSDVIGGYLVALLWMALAVAGLRATDPGPGELAGADARASARGARAVRTRVPE
jgi:membrane-associated phospholipid phosphatase